MLGKQNNLSLPRNSVLKTFGRLLIMFSKKGNLLYLLCSMALRCCLLLLIKQNCLQKTFLRTLVFMTQVSLYLVSCVKVYETAHFHGTSKLVRKVIKNLDSSKRSAPDCISVVVLKNCEPALSCILAEFFILFNL